MPDYIGRFKLDPAWPFGLPQAGSTVLPCGVQYCGPRVDTWTGEVGPEVTVSQYRSEPVRARFTLIDGSLELNDNELTVAVSADTSQDAATLACGIALRFCQTLSSRLRIYFRPTNPIVVRQDYSKDTSSTVAFWSGPVCWYNLTQVRGALASVGREIGRTDAKLDRARAYAYHAEYLAASHRLPQRDDTSPLLDPTRAFQVYYTLTEMILNYYKSISTIIGERKRGDRQESLWRKYGVSRELWERTEAVRRARNSMDVAHYTTEPTQFDALWKTAGLARDTATEIIDAYVEWLDRCSPPGATAEPRPDRCATEDVRVKDDPQHP
jgi:hypothetical protein